MPTPPNNTITRRFIVEVTIDRDDPKHPSIEDLENRIGDGPQWMDGVIKIFVRYDGNKN